MDDATVSKGDPYQTYLESTMYRSTGLGLTRDTRATVDQVMDPKTVEVLQKMQKQGVFQELAGCISTGKEANVYFGIQSEKACLAVKVYKTSILGFRDRDEYVDGEYRFRHGYCRSNPRKMVALWAEKEQRNLIRLGAAGVYCPSVVRCKRNVLVMTLVGSTDRAAPRLKDITREPSNGWIGVYLDVVRSMRRMFQIANLVHGDLSEYNMLLTDEDELFVIDVSQSVGNDHPRSLEFLKRDCVNVNRFFEKKLDDLIPLQELFHFVASEAFPVQAGRVRVTETASGLELTPSEEMFLSHIAFDSNTRSATLDLEDSVFLHTWVPSSLGEVDELQEVERIMRDRKQGISTVYDTLLNTPQMQESESENSDEESETSESEGDKPKRTSRNADKSGHRPEDISPEDWKKIVKEERREQRRNKVPKHLKHKRNMKKYGSK